MDKDSFYRWLERQERRFELVDGRPVMMVGVTQDHNKIAANIVAQLFRNLDRALFEIAFGEFAVENGDRIRYPDVMVFEPRPDGKARHAQRPILVVEILFETSLYIDLHDKAAEYTRLPTLATYAVLSQDGAKAWVWTRGESGMPARPEEVFGIDQALQVPGLGLSLPFAEIYRGIDLRQ